MDNNYLEPQIPSNDTVKMAIPEKVRQYKLSFEGNGGEYFAIVVLNFILTIFTFGLYYPWAKVKKLKYLYSSTEFESSRLSFTGTGKEMFKGFIKAVFIFIALYLIVILVGYLNFTFGIIVFYLGFLLIIPLAIHGTYRYRMARTFWRGIRFGYTGNLREIYAMMIKGVFLTIITLGIYGAWFAIDLRKYIVNNVKFGNLRFNYAGRGLDLLNIYIKGCLLSFVTFGIYLFWLQRDLIRYYIDNLSLVNEKGEKLIFKTQITAWQVAILAITNFLLIVFTLGFGTAWVVIRTMKFIFNNIQIEGNINLEQIIQTNSDYGNATGDDLNDMMDIGIVI